MGISTLDFDKFTWGIILIVLIFVLLAIVGKLFGFDLSLGVTNESLGLDKNVCMFKEEFKNDPVLYSVKLETKTALGEVKIKKDLKSVEEPKSPSDFSIYKIYTTDGKKYFNLEFTHKVDEEHPKLPNGYIENILVTFKVKKSWLNTERIDKKEGVRLLVLSNRHGWVENKADFLKEEGDYAYYWAGSSYQGVAVIVGVVAKAVDDVEDV